jgi:hypothetical protein
MMADKYGNYVRKFMWQLCALDRVDVSLTVHRQAILKILIYNIPRDRYIAGNFFEQS